MNVWQFFHRIRQIMDLAGDSKTSLLAQKFIVHFQNALCVFEMQRTLLCPPFFRCNTIFSIRLKFETYVYC